MVSTASLGNYLHLTIPIYSDFKLWSRDQETWGAYFPPERPEDGEEPEHLHSFLHRMVTAAPDPYREGLVSMYTPSSDCDRHIQGADVQNTTSPDIIVYRTPFSPSHEQNCRSPEAFRQSKEKRLQWTEEQRSMASKAVEVGSVEELTGLVSTTLERPPAMFSSNETDLY